MEAGAGPPLLRLTGITKAFPGVVALDDVDLGAPSGVHALTGENGSGKSTLARVINGSVQPDAGTISVEDAGSGSRTRARRCGSASSRSARS